MRKQGLGHHLIAALLVGVLGACPAHAFVRGAGGEAYSYAASGNLSSAGSSTYAYEDQSNAQAVTRIVESSLERLLEYDRDGHLIRDRRLSEGRVVADRVFTIDGASCVVHARELDDHGFVKQESAYLCDADGNMRGRFSYDRRTGQSDRVYHFGGNIEARPDEEGGVLIIRVPLVGTQVIFEDARSLATGAAIPERSAYLVTVRLRAS